MRIVAVTEETVPGRWTAIACGCRGDGATEAEALAELQAAVWAVDNPAPPALP